ncbi:MAG TPA: BlaI/MecI/CopY family transcriptional regulator [Pirellulales bacterium]
MVRKRSEQPTELELEILNVLWSEAPLLVRDVRARLEARSGRQLAHSSVITMLNIMYRKGFLRRQKQGKSFIFWPRDKKQNVAGRMIGDLVSRAFGGSASAMVLNLLETTDLDAEELAEIRKLVARKAKEKQP